MPRTIPPRGSATPTQRATGARATLSRPAVLRNVALASLVANALIVVTGGAVRLTGSGLGCPTWPKCTGESYTTTAEMGVHGAIEFGNRMLTGLVGILALAALLLALLHRRRELTVPAALVLAGIPAQAVLGGITVLTHLNPWVVGCHFLLSMAILVPAYTLWIRASDSTPDAGENSTVTTWRAPAPLRALIWATCVASAGVLTLGTVVTGSGPHAGDTQARRTGLDPDMITQLHVDVVFLLLGLSIALWLALRATGAPSKAAGILVLVELGQGLIGFVQHFTHLPVLLVGAHMAGACVVWIATLAVWRATLGGRVKDVPRSLRRTVPAPQGRTRETVTAQSTPAR